MKTWLLILKSILIREKQGSVKMEDGSLKTSVVLQNLDFLGSWGFLFVINV